MKIPDFDPAIARVLEAAGRVPTSPDGGIDAEAVARRLAADEDPLAAELSKDLDRVRGALEQLRADGLLEPLSGGSGYRLSALGRARVSGSDQDD